MSVSSLLASLLLLLILFSMLCGFVASWAWVTWRVRNGEPIVPRLCEPRREVPWGLGSVVLVILSWVVVNLTVVTLYAYLTQGNAPAAVTPAKKVAKAGAAPAKKTPGAGAAPAKQARGDAKAAAVDRTLGFTEQLAIVSMINAILLVTLPGLLRATSGAGLSDLGLSRRHLTQQIGVGMMAFFLVSPFVYALNAVAVQLWHPEKHPLEKMVRHESAMGIAELAVLSAVLLAPMTEELIFRGVIQRWLSRSFNSTRNPSNLFEEPASPTDGAVTEEVAAEELAGPWPESETTVADNPFAPPTSLVGRTTDTPFSPSAGLDGRLTRTSVQPIVLTSLLFAAVHFQQWPAPLGIFVLSLGLGYVVQQSGSLIAAMVMHSLFNGLGTFLLLLMVQIGGLPEDVSAKKPAPKPVEPPAGCVVIEQAITGCFERATARTVQHLWDQ